MNFISSNNFDESLSLDEKFNLDKELKLSKSILSLGEPFFYFIKIIEFPNQSVVSTESERDKNTNEKRKKEIDTKIDTGENIKEYKSISPELNKFKKRLSNISLNLSSNKEDIFSFIDNLRELKLKVISNKNLINSNLEFIEYSNFLIKKYKPDLILNLTSNSYFPYISNLISCTNPQSSAQSSTPIPSANSSKSFFSSYCPHSSHYPSTFFSSFTFKEIEINSFSYEEQLLINLSILYQCLSEIN